MFIVIPLSEEFGNQIECTKAVKGPDYIKLYDKDGRQIASFEGISDFSGYSLTGGDYSTPEPTAEGYLLDLDYRLSMVELGL